MLISAFLIAAVSRASYFSAFRRICETFRICGGVRLVLRSPSAR
jgi:hypothetical protein